VSDRIAVLCDFDGTIAQDDVGNLLFRTFARRGDPEPVVELWKQGCISSRECLEQEASLADVSREELNRFICQRKLDPYFKDFVDFTRRSSMEVVVVSDGLDHYIEKMLLRSGLGELEFYSNLMRLVDGNMHVSFPHYDMMDCRDCGNCKSHHLEEYRRSGHYIVYVGNGLSDRCPSERADFVFAKGELLDFCRENDIAHVAFDNFRDVEREMVKRFVLAGELGDEDVSGL
jgi:2,3-diketo-5-methylthio-1-phosphopentane phosphatase